MSWGPLHGQLARTRAANPATCGAAIDVPDFDTTPPPLAVEMIPLPGAATSTQVPRFESTARPSPWSVFATDRTFGHEPGHCWNELPLLPAVDTSTTP